MPSTARRISKTLTDAARRKPVRKRLAKAARAVVRAVARRTFGRGRKKRAARIDETWYVRPANLPTRRAAGGVVVRVGRDGTVYVALAAEKDVPADEAG